MKIRTVVSAVAAMALAGTAAAQSIGGGGGFNRNNQKLEVGSEAPKLSIAKWVKGEAVDELKEDHVYVVEFWATWCQPCLKSIPHLTEMQDEYSADITIIGISWEDVETVEPFVNKMGSKMDYKVAVDQRDQTKRAWYDAANAPGIPFAVIVVKNKVAWMGNPLDAEFDKMLANVADGRYDPELEEAAEPVLDQIDYAVRMQDWRVAGSYLDQVIEMGPYVFNDVAIKKFRIWLMEKDDLDGAIAYARSQFLDWYRDDPETLAKLAEFILSEREALQKGEQKLKQLALELANHATRGDGAGEPEYMRVKALALYHNGQKDEAIKLQERAWLMVTPERKAEFKRILDAYKTGGALRMHRR